MTPTQAGNETRRRRASTAKPVLGAVEARDDSAGDLVLEHVDSAQAETTDSHVEENVDAQALARGRGDTPIATWASARIASTSLLASPSRTRRRTRSCRGSTRGGATSSAC
jgi:hypothetical protein